MLIRYEAHTKTGTAENLVEAFKAEIRNIFTVAKGLVPTSDPEYSEIMKDFDRLIEASDTESPADMVEHYSWAWQVEDHAVIGGASGKCTVYFKGDIFDPDYIRKTLVERDEPGLHISMKAEVS